MLKLLMHFIWAVLIRAELWQVVLVYCSCSSTKGQDVGLSSWLPYQHIVLCCAMLWWSWTEVRAIVNSAGADKTVVLYCSQGGVLESNETHKRGWQTR